MKQVSIFSLILLVIYSLFFSSTAIAENKTIKVPVDAWPPFRIISEDNKYSGIDFEFLNELSKELDSSIDYKRYPWSRSLAKMEGGTSDLISGIAKTDDREKYIQYSNKPYYICSTVFYVLKGNETKIEKYDDLKNFRLGYVSNSVYFHKFDKDDSLNKRAISSELELIRMLAFKRVEVMIGTDCQVDYDISRLGFNDLISKANYKPGNEVSLYIGVSKKSPLINEMDKINEAIEKLLKNNRVEEISKKYFQ